MAEPTRSEIRNQVVEWRNRAAAGLEAVGREAATRPTPGPSLEDVDPQRLNMLRLNATVMVLEDVLRFIEGGRR